MAARLGYPGRVQRALIFFGFVWLSAGCGHAAPPVTAPAPPAPAPSVAPPRSRVDVTCRAEPSTVYGDEPVVFILQASSSTRVGAELVDESGARIAEESLSAPGEWRPEALPSGDFTLRLGEAGAGCPVTVNRELSRASQTKR